MLENGEKKTAERIYGSPAVNTKEKTQAVGFGGSAAGGAAVVKESPDRDRMVSIDAFRGFTMWRNPALSPLSRREDA
jgi:hypothetical protein